MNGATSTGATGRLRIVGTLVALAASVGVSQSFGRFTYSLLYTDLRDGFDLSNTAAGALGTLNLLAYVLGSLTVSITVSRTGLSGAARIGLFGAVAGLALLAWSPSAAITAVALALTGFAAAGVWIAIPGLAAELLGPKRRGAAAGWMTGGVGAGMVAAAAIDAVSPVSSIAVGANLATSDAASTTAVATVAASSAAAADNGTTDAVPALAVEAAELAAASLGHARSVYRIEAAIGIAVLIALLWAVRNWTRTPGRGGFSGAIAALRKVPHVGSLVATYSLYAFVVSTALTFIVGHLESYRDIFDARSAALAFSAIGVGSIAGGPIFGRIADRLGRRRATTTGLTTALVSLAILTANPTLTAGGRPLAYIAAFVFGTAFTGVIAAVTARISDSLSGDEFGAAYGAVTILFGFGLAAGPQIGGVLADLFDSFFPAFVLVFAACIIGIALTGWGDDPATGPGQPNPGQPNPG